VTPEARTRSVVWAVLALVLGGVIAVGLWRVGDGTRTTALPVYDTLPPFALIERSGRTITAADLAGRVWIADFIFTRCGGTCPVLSSRLAALLRELPAAGAEDVTGVSITVDPHRDDPATLQRYAAQYHADPDRWLFLTGPRTAVEGLVRDGFKLSVAEVPPEERATAVEPITHSDRFVLVDGEGRIRGYYHGTDPESVARLRADTLRLAGGG
jgi:cytochrome oxidase Cu insertion factor (SCO1/SenC/PrrC family)